MADKSGYLRVVAGGVCAEGEGGDDLHLECAVFSTDCSGLGGADFGAGGVETAKVYEAP
jgi:hypothetical protein